jgi:hypothetical protein
MLVPGEVMMKTSGEGKREQRPSTAELLPSFNEKERVSGSRLTEGLRGGEHEAQTLL